MADALDLVIARGPPQQDLGGQIAKLPDSYWAGLDEAYKRRNQNAFQEGIPKGPDGQPDWAAISSTILQKGGVPGVEPSVSTANVDIARQQLKLGQDISAGMGGLESPTGRAPINVPTVAPGGSAPTPSPPVSARVPGGDNGQTTIMAAVSPHFGENSEGGRVALAVAQRLGVDPNAPLPPEKFAQAQQLAQSAAAARRPQTAPVPPAQMGAPPRGSQPTTQDPEVQQQIARYTQIMSNPALPAPVREAAKLRLEAITKNAEPTGPQKEYDLARRQGYEGSFQQFQNDQATDLARSKGQGTAFAKRYETLTDVGSRAVQEIPQLQLAQKLMDDPNFYSGVGEKYNLLLKRAAVALGADPATAAPQEALRKIVSGSILSGLKGLQGVGQIRVAEINLLKDASASLENTPAANRILITAAQRFAQRNAAVAEMAQSYKNGNLDSGFDRMVADYDRKNPMFSDQEITNFRNIITGSKTVPADQPRQQFSTPAEVTTAVSQGRLKSGDTFTDGNGKVRRVP